MRKLWALLKIKIKRIINTLTGKRLSEQGSGLLKYCYNIARGKEEENGADYRAYMYEQSLEQMQKEYNLSRHDTALLVIKILIEFE